MDGDKFICCNCIGDHLLSEKIKSHGSNAQCSYCGEFDIGESLSSVAARVDAVYREFYGYAESYPVFYGDSDRPDYEQRGDSPEYIINMMLKCHDTDISDDICSFLSEEEGYSVMSDGADAMYDTTSCYQHIDVGAGLHYELWHNFCEDIKHGARFFSLDAHRTLSQVFDDINSYSSTEGEKPIRMQPICEIYRCRKVNSIEEMKFISSNPQSELDAPPKHVAKSGRMNPLGVSIFYGAFDKDTCIAELRPAVGERIICGTFKLNRPLKVFDFTVLNKVYSELSMFDPEYAEKLSQLEFLRNFESIISKAFLPSQSDLEYLPLQAMTEYLSRYVDGGVDGIIYPSAQTAGATKNIVVFKNSNRVKVEGDFISYLPESEPFLSFQEGSISIHEVQSVAYTQNESCLESYLHDMKYGHY
ncbi:MAG: hypothetical protein CMM76_17100 [Rhodospirillaceae bacterium]|jgi:hypothetical protein|nr:hypothetical protein [Rhodospirillaceae bacterium]|tara:strand:- start:21201 stop:22451 length:1251 start_codon:yes stop_codon:yes gene_type:complete